MAERLVTIKQFGSYIEADLAKQFLGDFGIESVVTGQNAANAYTGLAAVASSHYKFSKARPKRHWKYWNRKSSRRID